MNSIFSICVLLLASAGSLNCLTPQASAEQVFINALDTDRNGNLTLSELLNFVPSLNAILSLNRVSISDTELENFFNAADTNRNGSLSLAEVNAANPTGSAVNNQLIFNGVDNNPRNNQVSRAELSAALPYFNAFLSLNRRAYSQTEATFFFRSADLNEDNVVTLNEYLAAVADPNSQLFNLWNQIYDSVDADHSGFVTLSELFAALPYFNAILGLNSTYIRRSETTNWFNSFNKPELSLGDVVGNNVYTMLFPVADVNHNQGLSLPEVFGILPRINAVLALNRPSISQTELTNFYNSVVGSGPGLTREHLRALYG